MIKPLIYVTLIVFSSAPVVIAAGSYELGTTVETSNGTVELKTQGYANLNLLRFELNKVGNIALKGSISVEEGKTNILMWSKVQGNYYFTKLPELQEYQSSSYKAFSIPFSSPEHPITEVLLNIELPDGGNVKIKNLELEQSKQESKR